MGSAGTDPVYRAFHATALRESIAADEELSPLFKDVFLYHWKEESQHAIMDELELKRHDRTVSPEGRDKAVDEFIELVLAVDGILDRQAADDSRYFAETCGRTLRDGDGRKLERALRQAYRWQFIISGAQHPHFLKVLSQLITESQVRRIQTAVAMLLLWLALRLDRRCHRPWH
jgi:hypothetical protein